MKKKFLISFFDRHIFSIRPDWMPSFIQFEACCYSVCMRFGMFQSIFRRTIWIKSSTNASAPFAWTNVQIFQFMFLSLSFRPFLIKEKHLMLKQTITSHFVCIVFESALIVSSNKIHTQHFPLRYFPFNFHNEQHSNTLTNQMFLCNHFAPVVFFLFFSRLVPLEVNSTGMFAQVKRKWN